MSEANVQGRFKNLKLRAATAAALTAVFLALASLSAYSFTALTVLVVVGVIAVWGCAVEFAWFIPRDEASGFSTGHRGWMVLCLVLPALWAAKTLWVLPDTIRLPEGVALSLSAKGALLGFLAMLLQMTVLGRGSLERLRSYFAILLPAFCLIGVGGSALTAVALLEGTPRALLWLVAVVCLNDIAAYFGGSYFGGTKLSPALSPGKTISGSACGLLVGIAVGVGLGTVTHSAPVSVAQLAFLSVVVTLTAQGGDLLKSYLKRLSGVKDSSSLLPGHGGILDRLDGILAGSIATLLWW